MNKLLPPQTTNLSQVWIAFLFFGISYRTNTKDMAERSDTQRRVKNVCPRIFVAPHISDVTSSCSCSWNVSLKLDKSRIYLHIYLVFSSCILGSHYFVNLLALKFFTINPLYKVGRWTQGGLFHYNTFDILKPWPGHWPGLFWESKLWFVMLLGMVSKTF